MRKALILTLFIHLFLLACGGRQNSGESEMVVPAALTVDGNKTWKNGLTINVLFLDGEESLQVEVERIASEWSLYANLNFKFHRHLNELGNGSAHIRISFSGNSNESQVGTDANYDRRKTSPSMWLGTIATQHADSRKGTILHEFGHALGMKHEHQNPLRSFEFNIPAMKKHCLEQYGMNESKCMSDVINKAEGRHIIASKYDSKSVMHYDLHPGLTNSPTRLGYNNHLSLLDKIEISKIYPGRMTPEEILVKHKEELNQLEDVHVFKNCRIQAEVFAGVLKYSYEALEDEYENRFFSENKADAAVNMKADNFCNMTLLELQKWREERKSKIDNERAYGQCVIPNEEDAKKVPVNCMKDFPHLIAKKDLSSGVNNSCYPTFDSAREAMLKEDYCSLTDEEVLALAKQTEQEFQDSRNFNGCYIARSPETKMKGVVRYSCPESHPYFVISSDWKEMIIEGCSSSWKSKYDEMVNNPKCQ